MSACESRRAVAAVLVTLVAGAGAPPAGASFSIVDTTAPPANTTGVAYYVDNTRPDNTGSGLSPATAKKTVGAANALPLNPGDYLLFKRGQTFTDAGLNISRDGTVSAPIYIGAYGTGARPIFDGGGNYANGSPLNPVPGPWPTYGTRDPVRLTGDWIFAEEFVAQQANYGGVTIDGAHCEARNFLSRWNVAGVDHRGTYAELHHYEILDNAVMSRNDNGGEGDSGAFGHAVFGHDGDFHHFISSGHRATSYDYGMDGSAIELYGGKRNSFHHFIARDDQAMTELGNGETEDTTYSNFVYHSVAGDNRIGVNIQGSAWNAPLRTTVHHGTIYLPAGTQNAGMSIGTVTSWTPYTGLSAGDRRSPTLTNAKANGHIYEVIAGGTTGASEPTWPTNGGTVTDASVTWRDLGMQAEIYNNVVVASGTNGWAGAPVDENNNLYYGNSTQQMRSMHSTNHVAPGVGSASMLATNPLFLSTNPTSADFLRLSSSSPAVDAGALLGYSVDLAGNPRVSGSAPDIGAYEYDGGGPPALIGSGALGQTPNSATAAMTASGATLHAGTAAGDFLVMEVYFDTGATTSGQAITAPPGWALLYNLPLLSSGNILRGYYKVAGASEGAPVSPTFNGATTGTAGGTGLYRVSTYRDVDVSNLPSSALAGITGGNGFWNLQNMGQIVGFTPTASNTRVVVHAGKKAAWTSVAALTGDGLTWVEEHESPSWASGDAGMVTASAPIPGSAIAISNKSFTVTGGATAHGLGIMFALRAG